MDLIILFKILLRKWKIWVIVPFVSIIAAFFLTEKLPDVYKSTAQLETGFTTSNNVLSEDKVSIRDIQIRFNNLIQNLKSNQVLDLVSYRLILHDLDTENIPFRSANKEILQNSNLTRKDVTNAYNDFKTKLDSFETISLYNPSDIALDRILKAYKYHEESLKESIKVIRVNGTDYIDVIVNSENPHLSAFISNAFCEEAIRVHQRNKFSENYKTIKLLQDLLKEKKNELEEKRNQLKLYRSTNQVYNNELLSQSMIMKLDQYELAKNEEIRKINALKLSIGEIDSRLNGLSNDNKNNSSSSRIIELRQQINRLNERYISSGMKDQEILDSLNLLRKQYSIETANIQLRANSDNSQKANELIERKSELQTELKISESYLNDLNRRIAAIKSNASTFATKGTIIKEMEEEVNLINQEYISLQDKLNETRNLVAISSNSLKQSLIGQPAQNAEPSQRIILVAFSGIASFLFCVVLIISLEFLDPSIKNNERFEHIIKRKATGSIPYSKHFSFNTLFNLFDDNDKIKDSLQLKESLRKIRHQIVSGEKGALLVTSTNNGTGKSFLLLSLAMSLSKIEKKVLIIDSNFKNNHITREVQKRINTKGNDVKHFYLNKFNKLAGQIHEIDIDKIVSKGIITGVDIIFCKQDLSSPNEILGSENFKSFMGKAQSKYDFILMEGASINEYSDSKELIPFVNAIIAVFSAKQTISTADRNSINYISSIQNKTIYPVLNFTDERNEG